VCCTPLEIRNGVLSFRSMGLALMWNICYFLTIYFVLRPY